VHHSQNGAIKGPHGLLKGGPRGDVKMVYWLI
jgi:hypothetical protein